MSRALYDSGQSASARNLNPLQSSDWWQRECHGRNTKLLRKVWNQQINFCGSVVLLIVIFKNQVAFSAPMVALTTPSFRFNEQPYISLYDNLTTWRPLLYWHRGCCRHSLKLFYL